jgi:RND family efflux transporter MFP subunit
MNWFRYKKIAITAVSTLCAMAIVLIAWRYYEVYPRTPDGRIRADIVPIAPDVTGLITRVFVVDNQTVKAGDALFEIDKQRFQIDADRAQAALLAKRVALAQAERVAHRNAALNGLVSKEEKEAGQEKVDELAADVQQAETDLAIANLNLARSTVKASVDGKVTNLSLRPGAYASAGKPVFALIDSRSIHVDGYFEETKLRRIHVGDAVRILLMGESRPLRGHVLSISGGIEDRDRATGGNLLADVNPTFSWIRLAQRIPVRIAIDERPTELNLVLGRTAAVEILRSKTDADK